MNALEQKYDAAREKAVQMLRECGMYSEEFKRAFDESFAISEELKRQHPDSELLKVDFLAKMFKERKDIENRKND